MPQRKHSAGGHVAALAFPFSTHAAPLLSVIRQLAAATPATHFSFFNTLKSNQTLLSSTNEPNLQEPNMKVYNVWDGIPEGYTFVGKPQEEIELFMKAAPESFGDHLDAATVETGKEVSLLVTDAFFWFAAEMAEEKGVTWVPFWTAGPASLSSHFYTDLIRNTLGGEGFEGNEEKRLTFIPGMSKIYLSDLPEGIVFGNLESLFSNMLHKMGQMLPNAEAVIVNSFEELDLTITNDMKSKLKNFLSIGPLKLISPPSSQNPPILDSYGCIPWLNKQKDASVAYISFGSVTVPPSEELVALAEALEKSGVPFIWSLKDQLKVHLPNGFLDRTKGRGMVVSWAPQEDVLGHGAIGVFITHCGWNSLLESIAGGVPMICRPFFGDQRLNGRRIQEVWEIGLIVEGGKFTKKGIMKALELILFREKGKKMRRDIKALQELAQSAVRPQGSSSENFEALLNIVTGPSNV